MFTKGFLCVNIDQKPKHDNMISYSDVRQEARKMLERAITKGGDYSKNPEWKTLISLLERANEVTGIVMATDHNNIWQPRIVFSGEDSVVIKKKLESWGSQRITHYSVYHRVGFTKEMYERLYSIPKSLDGLDRLAVLAQDYAKNLSLSSVDHKIIFYCGPVNDTGGFFDLGMNLEHLFRSIVKGASKHDPVFDQTVFESHLVEITKQVKSNPAINQAIVLEKFYKPLYHNWLVREMRFLYNWETSGGARWERSIAIEKGIPQMILPKDYVDLSFVETGKVAPQN